MTKSILKLTVALFITSAALTSCNTSAQKVDEAQNNVAKANEDLEKANKEYLADVENYKKETSAKIASNDQIIADLKEKLKHEKKQDKADYKKMVDELEQKNTEMKKKLDDYKADSKEKWVSFKTEFNHDMDELGKAFKDLTVNNVK